MPTYSGDSSIQRKLPDKIKITQINKNRFKRESPNYLINGKYCIDIFENYMTTNINN